MFAIKHIKYSPIGRTSEPLIFGGKLLLFISRGQAQKWILQNSKTCSTENCWAQEFQAVDLDKPANKDWLEKFITRNV